MGFLDLVMYLEISTLRQSQSTLVGAFLALSLNPDVVKRAQAELDAAVGSDRMPDFDDKDRLPYIQAVVDETMR